MLRKIKDFLIKRFKRGIICYGHCFNNISKQANISIKDKMYFNSFPYSKNQKANHGQLIIGKNSTLIVTGKASFRSGNKLVLFPNSTLTIGDGLFVNFDTSIYVRDSLIIGDGVVISQNVVIRDSDVHKIAGKENHSPIKIGNHVWIGTNAIILKGVTIGDGSVVAGGGLLQKMFRPNAWLPVILQEL